MKTRIRFFSALLTLCMAFTLVPTTVLAAGSDTTNEYEATAGETAYSTLKEALEAGGEVTLLKDVEVSEVIHITKDTTLDLGDFTITNNVTEGRPLNVTADNFTVRADNGGMIIPGTNTTSYGFIEAYVKNLVIEGGRYEGNTDNGTLFRFNSTESNIDGADFRMNGVFAETNNQIFGVNGDTFNILNASVTNSELYAGTRALYFDVYDTTESSTISINSTTAVVQRGPVIEVAGGNTVLSDNDWTVTGDYTGGYTWARAAVGVGYEGVVTVNSGTYRAASEYMADNEGYGIYIYSSGGSVTVNGGTFEGTTASLRADSASNYNSPSKITVNDGNFSGDAFTGSSSDLESIIINGGDFTGLSESTTSDSNNLTINGGSFDRDVSSKVSQGKEVIGITKNNNTTYYIGAEKVAEGISEVTAGDKINVIQNITDIEVPNGVEVTNNTGEEITVNGRPVTDDTPVISEEPSKVSTEGLNDSYTAGDVVEFKVTAKPASYDKNTMVKGYITGLSEEEKELVKVWYKESKDGEWYPLTTDDFGPANGFPFVETSSEFRIQFLKTGEITFDIEIRTVDGDRLLASASKAITVTEKVVSETPDDEINNGGQSPTKSETKNPDNNKAVPQTGDTADFTLPIILLSISGISLAGTFFYLRKRKYNS